jgi:hypothetical protein
MALYMQPLVSHQEALTSQYSVLHQQRLYLLSALAEVEDQGERLIQSLGALETQIHGNEATEPPLSTKKLRQQVRSVRNRLTECQHQERALAANLSQLVAQMEGMKRYQWRQAQHDYQMQIQQAQQHAQMVLLSPARPGFALRSPAAMDLATQMHYMSLDQPTTSSQPQAMTQSPYFTGLSQHGDPSSFQGTGEQMYISAIPVLTQLNGWEGFNDVRAGPLEHMSPVSPMSTVSMPTMSPIATEDVTEPMVIKNNNNRPRSVSMLTSSTYNPSLASIQESRKSSNSNAMRRLSLLDGGAAIKLEKEANKAAQASMHRRW